MKNSNNIVPKIILEEVFSKLGYAGVDPSALEDWIKSNTKGTTTSPHRYPAGDINELIRYLGVKIDELKPSFARGKKREHVSYTGKSGKRFVLKTTRFLTRNLDLNKLLKDDCLAEIARNINEKIFANTKIKVIKGKEITDAYKKRIGGNSCMAGECADYTLLYEMNPDKIQMVVAIQGTGSARCILWLLDCGLYYADRIYSNTDHTYQTIIDFVAKNRWKSRRNYEESEKKLLKVSNLRFRHGHVPYMDTFFYGIINKQHLLDVSQLSSRYSHGLCSTEGQIEGYGDEDDDEEYFICYICGGSFPEDEMCSHSDHDYCEECYDNNFVACNNCGTIINTAEATIIENLKLKTLGVNLNCVTNAIIYFCPTCALIQNLI